MRTLRTILIVALVLVLTTGAFGAQQYLSGLKVGTLGLTVKDATLDCQTSAGTSRAKILRSTGVLTATPQAATTNGWAITGNTTTGSTLLIDPYTTLTTGSCVTLTLDSDVFTAGTGKFINCLGGSDHATSKFSITGEGNVTAAGTINVSGASTLASLVCTAAGTFGGGYGSTGATIATTGNIQTNGTLTVDSTSTLTGAVTVGTGYAGTGTTLGATGAIQAKGALTVDGASTLSGAVTTGSTATGPGGGDVIYRKYARITVASINSAGATGVELLPAVAGRQYRILNARILAYGGAMTSTNATSLEIVSDPAGTPVVLYQVLKAQLAQATTAGVGINTMVPCTTSTVLLADGASFVAQVANKKISLITTGTSVDWATATGVDVGIEYVVL